MKIERRPKKYSLQITTERLGDSAFLMDDGKLFHARTEATAA